MSILRNAVTLLQGTAVAQLIALLALPLLSRLYVPSDFGLFQIYQSAMTVAMTVSAGRYELALLEARVRTDRLRILELSLVLNGGFALASAGLAATAAVVGLLPGPAWVWALVPLAALVAGVFQTLSYLVLANQEFGRAAQAKVVQTLGYLGVALGLGYGGAALFGLVLADLAGRSLAILKMAPGLRPLPGVLASTGRRQRWRTLIATARRRSRYPAYSLPAGILNTTAVVMTPILLYGRFDLATLGQFALVERFVIGPVGLLAQAVAQAALGGIAQKLRDRDPTTTAVFRKTTLTCAWLATGPTLLLLFFGPWCIVTLFGPNWEQAGRFTQIMAPMLFMSFVGAPSSLLLNVLGAQRAQLGWDICRCLALAGAWTAIYALDLGPTTAVALHVTVVVLSYAWLIRMVGIALDRTGHASTQGT